MSHVIHEHRTHVHTPDGLTYVPRTYGQQEPDGTWHAWIDFHPIDTSRPVLRTDRETSQATREAIETWTSGLEATYFEGAFARARVVANP
jgi:hypothetical protein